MDPAGQPSEPPKGKRPLRVGATGRSPIGPLHPAEIGPSLPEEGQPGRCFLPRSSLPRATTESSRNCQTLIVTPAEPGVYPRAIINPQSALHYVECRAALNLTWFRAKSAIGNSLAIFSLVLLS
jgi:hypothetical protein